MFSPRPQQNRCSLKILDNKSVQQLSSADQAIFIREYFKNISINLTSIIGENGYILGFDKENADKVQPFITALYAIRRSPESKDNLARYPIIEDNMLDVYKSAHAWILKNELNNEFFLGNSCNFIFCLSLIMQNFYPDTNNPTFDLSTLLGKSAERYSRVQFKSLQTMVTDPLAHILKLERSALIDKLELFLIDHRSFPIDSIHEEAKPEMSKWLIDYPRIDHAEAIQNAIIKFKHRLKIDETRQADIEKSLFAVFDELKSTGLRPKSFS